MKSRFAFFILIFAISLPMSFQGVFAGDYPQKDIKHIMPWGAGGGTDTVMRTFMKEMESELRAKIYTVNIDGAKSGLGVTELMASAPDGYTVGSLTYDSIITVPYFGLLKNYSLDKLEYIATVTVHPTVLVAHVDSKYQTIEDLISEAKKAPGKVKVSNVGLGGVWHLPMIDLEQQAGIQLDHIAFAGGSGEQREALLKRETDLACLSIGGIFPLIKAKKARILAMMSEERLPEYPDVPTLKEKGYDVVWGSLRSIAVPKGVDPLIIKKLEQAAEKTANNKKWQEWLEKNGGGWAFVDGAATQNYVQTLQKKVFTQLDELVSKGVIKK
jgi:tripartite-type tricarboxylate transporter receptor subunit TctC